MCLARPGVASASDLSEESIRQPARPSVAGTSTSCDSRILRRPWTVEGAMGLMWPSKVTANPSFVQVLARIVHWAGALAGVYYVGSMLLYLYGAHGSPDWSEVFKRLVLGAGCILGARAFRFVVGQE